MKSLQASAVPRFDDLIELVLYRANLHPEKPAYIFLAEGETEQRVLTYGGLLEQARLVASLLRDRGGQGQPVILAYEPGLDFVIAFWGCLLAGSIAVPTYSTRGAHRVKGLNSIVEDSGALLALTHQPYMTNLSRVLVESHPLGRLTWLRTDTDLGYCAENSLPLQAHRTAVLQYTSGSTGRPKGVQITHANVLSNEEAMHFAFGHDESAVIINCLPHYHDMGLFGNLLQPFYLGALCVSMSPAAFVQKPSRLLTAITRYQGTTSGGPNFVYALCADKMPASGLEIDLSSWYVAYIGAERIRPEVQRRFLHEFERYGFRRECFRACYGLAEATLCVSAAAPNTHPLEDRSRLPETVGPKECVVSCGVAHGRQSFLIVDPVTKEICGDGREGEVWLEGLNVAQGYWRNEAATNEVFRAFTADGRGPFLRTGDCGYTSNEELFISGRLSGFIIVDGENFHAEDLEVAVADAHPAIQGGKCMAIPVDQDGREDFVLVAEVARAYLRTFDSKSPADAIYKKLTGLHGLVPRTIIFVKTGGVPCTPNGKLNRQAGRQAFLSHELPILGEWKRTTPATQYRQTPDVSDGSPAAWLIQRIADRLGVDPAEVPMDQPFATLGCDSLDLIEIAEELSEHSGIEIDPVVMWEYPTIAELTFHLSKASQLCAVETGDVQPALLTDSAGNAMVR